MPIIKQSRRINPLNLDNNTKIGVAFPLNETNLFKGTSDTKTQAKSNLLNLLFTHPGERVNLPTFGVGLKELIFEQKINIESLKNIIQSQTNRFVPNIYISNLKSEMSEDEHTLNIFLTYIYKLDNSSDSIQFNFRY
jgi:phage baseplate assembly protein W